MVKIGGKTYKRLVRDGIIIVSNSEAKNISTPAQTPTQPSKIPTQPSKIPTQPSKIPTQPSKIPTQTPKIPKTFIIKRSGKTYNGVERSIAISAIQKYIRRCNLKKAKQVAIDIDLHSLSHDPEWFAKYINMNPALTHVITQSKAIRTNMINRLRVITVEDIYQGNTAAPAIVDKLIEIWNTSRHKPRSSMGRRALMQIVNYLCSCRKGRMLSHIKSVYMLPPYSYGPGKKQISESSYRRICATLKERKILKNFTETKTPFIEFKKLSEAGNPTSFHYLSVYLRDRSTKNLKTQYSELREYIGKSEDLIVIPSVMTILKWYDMRIKSKNKEAILFLYTALMYRYVIKDDEQLLYPISTIETRKLYDRAVAGYTIKIDDFCKDIHTTYGGSLVGFITHGAVICNESEYLNRQNEMIYNLMKRLFQAVLKKPFNLSEQNLIIDQFGHLTDYSSIISDEFLAQKRTGKHKKFTYLSPKYVVKGPYLPNEDSLIRHKYVSRKFTTLELILELNESRMTRLVTKDYYDMKTLTSRPYQPAPLTTSQIGQNKKKHYIVFHNMGDFDEKQFHISDSIDGKVKVLRPTGKSARQNYHILDILSAMEKRKLNKFEAVAVLQHLYIRQILGVGDTGSYNIAGVRNQQFPYKHQRIFGYDMEERRSLDKFMKFSNEIVSCLFQSKIGAKKLRIYKKYVPYIKRLSVEKCQGLLDKTEIKRLIILNRLISTSKNTNLCIGILK
jgi:hypothetical protein